MDTTGNTQQHDSGPVTAPPVLVATGPGCRGTALARPLESSDLLLAACIEPGPCWWSGTLESAQVLGDYSGSAVNDPRDQPVACP